jgi:quinol monooxygenase YgiN
MKTLAWVRRGTLGAALIAACTLSLGMDGAAQAQGAPQSVAASAPAVAGPFILMIQLHVKADREKDFLNLLAQMTHRVKTQDRGNIRYELFAVAPLANAAAGPAPAINYVFLEEWRDQAAATAHGKWAGPIVRTQWREMTDSMQLIRLSHVPPR